MIYIKTIINEPLTKQIVFITNIVLVILPTILCYNLRITNLEVTNLMKKDINTYLETQISGLVEPNSAEKKSFLGVLSERILVCMRNNDFPSKKQLIFLEKMIEEHPGGQLKINIHLNLSDRMQLISLAQKHQIPFTVVDNHDAQNTMTSIGMVYHFTEVTNQSPIFISELI